jgi:hypothetical protein
MAQNDFNTIIGQIENDLKNLQSAKEQVENVVISNKEFADAANNLIINTHSVVSEIKIASENAIEQFSVRLNETQINLENLSKESQRQTGELVSTANKKIAETASNIVTNAESTVAALKKETKNTLEQLSKQLSDAKVEVEAIASKSINSIDDNIRKIENTHKTFNENAVSKITEVSKLASTSIEEQKSENLKALNQILETHNQIKKLIGQLLDLKIPETLKNINENFECLRKENIEIEENNKRRFKTTKTIMGITLTIVVIVSVVVVLRLFSII